MEASLIAKHLAKIFSDIEQMYLQDQHPEDEKGNYHHMMCCMAARILRQEGINCRAMHLEVLATWPGQTEKCRYYHGATLIEMDDARFDLRGNIGEDAIIKAHHRYWFSNEISDYEIDGAMEISIGSSYHKCRWATHLKKQLPEMLALSQKEALDDSTPGVSRCTPSARF